MSVPVLWSQCWLHCAPGLGEQLEGALHLSVHGEHRCPSLQGPTAAVSWVAPNCLPPHAILDVHAAN